MRQVILDTETTGLEAERGHRIIEIGCVEMISRRVTGNHFHQYLNPERDIDAGAQAIHGLSRERLATEPLFAAIAPALLSFIGAAELVIHNADFDLKFLDAEFARTALVDGAFSRRNRAVDSLALARELHPGQRNNLDALCKRYNIDNSRRELHGALLDAQILAEVYLAMTGGQVTLALGEGKNDPIRADSALAESAPRQRIAGLCIVAANPAELAEHENLLQIVDKAAGQKALWRNP